MPKGMKRQHVNKRHSAKNFNRHASKSHKFNIMIERGGWRL